MSRRFWLAPEAQSNLREIRQYYLDRGSPSAARAVVLELKAAFRYLARNPYVGHKREDLTDWPVRFSRVYSYLIVYRPETKPLYIICVLHGSRDISRILATIRDVGTAR